ncbi:glycoside hydrolase family 43 protein [Catenovulum sp. SX2]|uniref:glycoside hydrolase family 43 protein n=1 Tax=Catenovulum sp. SX2 TaxID=3398614 RepID=UPI003F837540
MSDVVNKLLRHSPELVTNFMCKYFIFICLMCSSALAELRPLPKNTPSSALARQASHHIDTLNIHDPAVLADPVSKKYYVYDSFHYGSEYETLESTTGRAGVEAYWSDDLVTWHGPKLVYEVEQDSWAQSEHAPWAPEVAYYQGKYYLFATLHNYQTVLKKHSFRPDHIARGTQIFVADSPLGPFKRFANKPHTPADEMALDGTLYIEDGKPWMIYCQEWIQTSDGLFKAIQLTDDLSATVGDPIVMFSAAEVPWTAKTTHFNGKNIRATVSDGPWPYKNSKGQLSLLWSSWNQDKHQAYTTSIAYSQSGKLIGPWLHRSQPLIADDRGHGNIFSTFDGQLMLSLHRYFKQPHTRLQLFEIEENGSDLIIKQQVLGHQ